MTFERGEIVVLEKCEEAEVVWDNGHEVDLIIVTTGEHTRRTVTQLLEIEAQS
jgi:hypothetical protein